MRTALALFIALWALGPWAGGIRAKSQAVRVGLYFGPSAPGSLLVGGQGHWQGERDRGTFDGELRITARGDELAVVGDAGEVVRPGRWISLSPTWPEQPLSLDGERYRGVLRIKLRQLGRLQVVNILDLEDYLRGVVPNEIFAQPGALEAQAVASRTLALYIRDVQHRHQEDGFDLCASGHCQVYRGVGSETNQASQAVRRTRGQVLTHHGRVILAAYHANAGGHTAPTDQAWPGSYRLEYLTPVPSPYDVVAVDLHYPDCYQWTVTATADQIRQRVRSVTGKEVGAVREVRVSPWETGRIMDLHIIGARGEARVWRPHDVRVVLGLTGQDTGESYDHDTRLVSVHTGKDGFVITGYGAGEGVGLSQHGAIGMARAGISYQQILGHYYRGVALAQDYGRGARRPLPPPDLTDPALPAGEKLARAR